MPTDRVRLPGIESRQLPLMLPRERLGYSACFL